MTALTRAHTADLDERAQSEIRAFLDEAFTGELTAEDWDHTIGGVHVLLREDGELMGHAAVVQRRLVVSGVGLRTGYVEAVAVRSDRRRSGFGSQLMSSVEDVLHAAYGLGALSASEPAARLYVQRGWRRWDGPTWTLSPDGPVRTEEEDGGVFVLPTPTSPELDLTGPIACDWRPGDVW